MTSEKQWLQEAMDHHHAGRLQQAAELYQRVLRSQPNHGDALYLLGVIAQQTGNLEQSVQLNCRALEVSPDDARCFNVLGLALMGLGKYEEAEASFQQAIALDDNPEFHNNLGTFWKDRGRWDQAVEAFRHAVRLAPGYANAHYNLGNTYRARGEMDLASNCFQQAVGADPGHAPALVALGQVLQALHRPEEAIPHLQRALERIDGDPDLHCDLGDAFQTLKRLDDAVEQYRRALGCDPASLRAWYAMGCAESSRGEHAAASTCFRKALECDPESRESIHNLGHSLFKLGHVDEAMKLFRQAAELLEPEAAEAAIAVLIPGDPGSSNADILEARRTWAEAYLPPPRPAGQSHRRDERGERRLRIGYVSAFFADHNWMKPVWGLVNRHDRRSFEVHLFSDAPASRIQHGYCAHPEDRFHDISGLSTEVVADRIEEAGIDILVDLNGYSACDRLPLFAARPAPVIVGWFNMYATTGMSCYDYLVGDDIVIPPAEEEYYTEKIVRLPGSYLTFEVSYPVPDVAPLPCAGDRPFTFGCLASQYKITADVIAVWSSILQQVPGSSLLLKNSALGSTGNRRFVEQHFEAHGIPPERLRLEGPSDHYRFLEAYGHMDLALDTFPYNGGTTTTEAIWQGVPVVTYWGDRWVSRTSTSILEAGGLGEFVARDVEGYRSLAIRLATAPGCRERLQELRREMRPRLLRTSVCDTASFARHMEELYSRVAR